MKTSHWEKAIKVTSEVMRARTRRVEESLKPFAGLFNACAEAIAEGLRSITPLAVKCSVSEADLKRVPCASLKTHSVSFVAGGNRFAATFRADREFTSLLCDAGLGGNGLWVSASDDPSRPPSKFEGMLVNHFVKVVSECVPKAYLATTGLEIALAEQDGSSPNEPAGEEQIRCISAKFLVNVVSLSAEITIFFPQGQLEQAVGASVLAPKQAGAGMGKALANCPFEVAVLLPQQFMNIDKVMTLEPDSILRLDARPHDFALLKVEGMEVAKGKIRIQPHKVGILLQ